MIYFIDTSALVKRYVEEAGSDKVRSLFRRRVEIAVARITEAEGAAALARACRSDEITVEQRDLALQSLADDMNDARVVEIRKGIVQRVRELVVRWPLRGYDAVQLACALRIRSEGSSVDLWCSDGVLLAAAQGEGLKATIV